MIICHDLSKSFRLKRALVPVLEQVSLSVNKGESVAVLGPSGCGKSTLLGLIAGFYPPDSGSVETQGRISLMMQQDMLLANRTVLANAALPAEIAGRARAAALAEARSLLPLFGLDGFGESYPAQLSGGMRQRAALLRTAMMQGDFWLLDEPFGKLDALTREEMGSWLLAICQRYQPGLLLVTHDIHEALRLCSRVYVMTSRPGRIAGELIVKPGAAMRQAEEIRSLLALGRTPTVE